MQLKTFIYAKAIHFKILKYQKWHPLSVWEHDIKQLYNIYIKQTIRQQCNRFSRYAWWWHTVAETCCVESTYIELLSCISDNHYCIFYNYVNYATGC
jgi:hypothetical protein